MPMQVPANSWVQWPVLQHACRHLDLSAGRAAARDPNCTSFFLGELVRRLLRVAASIVSTVVDGDEKASGAVCRLVSRETERTGAGSVAGDKTVEGAAVKALGRNRHNAVGRAGRGCGLTRAQVARPRDRTRP